jgi:predicted transcriptional regulator of viral defense system
LQLLGFAVKIIEMRVQISKEFKALLAQPVFRADEARKIGIHPSRLSYYVKINLIERIGRGVYRGKGSRIGVDFQWEDLVLVANSVPKAVICLVSALAIYQLTDEIPRENWIAIPHGTTNPKRENTRVIRMRDIKTGMIRYKLGNQTIKIFNEERTIIDAFRYLSKEIAIKALKEALKSGRSKKFDLKLFQKYAKQFRINLDTYILTVTT